MISEKISIEVRDSFVASLNSRNEKKFQEFIDKFWDAKIIQEDGSEDLIDYFFDIMNEIEQIEIYDTIIENQTKLSLIIRNRKIDEWLKCYFVFSTDSIEKIKSIGMIPVNPPKAYQKERLKENELTKRLDEYLRFLSEKDLFSGAVLLAKNEEIIYQNFFGFADRAFQIKPNNTTLFNLGSLGKMFTALAIGQLVLENKIQFDDKLKTILPELKIDKSDEITIHHLLTHTSGLGDIFCPEFTKNKEKYIEIKEIVKLLENKPLKFKPGERFLYSNGGFNILGLIIEKLSGKNYFEYVKENIFTPLKMINTGFYFIDDPIVNRATGYTKIGVMSRKIRETDWKINTRIARLKGCAAGGGYSTLDDLFKFGKSLFYGTILNQRILNEMISAKVKKSEKMDRSYYGYGFGITEYNNFIRIGHNGGSPGVNAYFAIFKPFGYIFIVLSNFDPYSAERIGKKFEQLLTQINR